MKIEITIPDEAIEDVFVTAIEGGSNYWYWIKSKSVDMVREYEPKGSFSVALYKSVMNHGADIQVHDVESGDLLGTLSYDSIKDRIANLMESEHAHRMFNMMKGDYDAEDADVVFQYMVMNEIVFG